MLKTLSYILVVTVVASFFTRMIVIKASNAYDESYDTIVSHGQNIQTP